MGSFTLSCRTSASLDSGYDPSSYVVEYTGEVLYEGEDGEEGLPEMAGEFSCCRVKGSRAAGDGVDVFEVCDSESEGLHEACYALISLNSRDYRPRVRRAVGVTEP